MKRTLSCLILVLAMMAVPTVSQAQKNNSWFIGTGIGCNLVFDNAKVSPASPAGMLYVGDWITPAFGVRGTVQGILARPADPGNNWFSENTFFGFYQLHADALWHVMNTFTSPSKKRVWNPVPYARVSGVLASSLGTHKGHVGIGGGLLNQFRINDFMSIALDLNAIVTNEKVFRTDHSGHFVVFGSATVGVLFDLNFRSNTE